MTDITLHLQSYNLDSDSPFTTIKYFAQILLFEELPLQSLTTLVESPVATVYAGFALYLNSCVFLCSSLKRGIFVENTSNDCGIFWNLSLPLRNQGVIYTKKRRNELNIQFNSLRR